MRSREYGTQRAAAVNVEVSQDAAGVGHVQHCSA